jgi:hypothetical protein
MRLLGRLVFLVPLALLFAIPAGMLALGTVAVFDPVVALFSGEVVWAGMWSLLDRLSIVDDPAPIIEGAFAGLSKAAATLLVAPPLFVGVVGEVAGVRSALWYAGGTGAITAAIPWIVRASERVPTAGEIHITLALFVAGAAAGLVYWLIAGQSAGARGSVLAAPGPVAR